MRGGELSSAVQELPGVGQADAEDIGEIGRPVDAMLR
jgi:hypothetical protein